MAGARGSPSRSKARGLPVALGLFALGACLAAVPCVVLTQPKRPPSSYMLWLSENRAKITEEIGTNAVAEVAKEAGRQWGELGVKDKKSFNKQASELKEQYQEDMQAFLDAGGVKEVSSKRVPKNGKKARRKKDPNAPKKPTSAYMLWLKDNRPKIRASLPAEDQSKVTEVAKAAGAKWKKVAARTKKSYQKKWEVAKEKYEKDMAAYTAEVGAKE